MIERRGSLRFLLEAAQTLGVVGEGRGQDFDRHIASQPFITRAINDSHPATPQQGQNFVYSDVLSCEQLRSRSTKIFRLKSSRFKLERVPLDKALRRPVIAQ